MNKTLQFFIGGIVVLIAIWVAGYTNNLTKNPLPKIPPISLPKLSALLPSSLPAAPATTPKVFTMPIDQASLRITKKFFATYVTPKSSPVTPERFKGYHTGVDFETSPSEQGSDINVNAICSGKLILKKSATGYGGVAVQSCTLDHQPITVVYGHLKLSSITINLNADLKAGEKIGILGKGYSSETDGERKHLHLGIHHGSAINILGYVQKTADLASWVDFANYLRQ